MKSKTILFTQFGSFSHINNEVLKNLRLLFPEYDFEVIDLKRLIKTMGIYNKIMLLSHTIIDLQRAKKLSLKNIKSNLTSNSFFWELSRGLIFKNLKAKNYAFSFQTQSLFDGNIKTCPHLIYTDHTHLVNLTYPEFDQRSLKSSKWLQEETKLYTEASVIFTMSNHVRNSLINDYSIKPEKVNCVFAGANVSIQNFDLSKTKYQNKKILFVGVDWERKGGPQLIDAFKLVLKKIPDAQLDVVGCSPDIDIQNVNVWGKIPINEVKGYYEKASLFCMPSKREPFGIAYLEAMSFKLPILALNIGALPDFVINGKNGYLVAYNDIIGLSIKLIYLLENPEICEKMGQISYEKVSHHYQWNSTVGLIKDFIQKQGIITS